ncbi:sugar phosphate nucleotidyltransferase [Salinigranum marinum]|uniref:sugar phosphate nucleotidyltransferase n=1 Tax=Salinigranum marinum TaxID=1515595 RepID=UPI002989FB40|nr:sugar phosphate nucleotidyltransferase [Salinigranum marinum]
MIAEAVVLAAGEGRRLRPLTKYQPKPMLPVANRPVVEYVVDALVAAGVERIVCVVGHRADRIQTHLTKRYPDLDLAFVRQERRLGSGHALLAAAAHVGERFLVVNGDNVVDADTVRATIARGVETDAVATVAVAHSETPEAYGVVVVDHGRIADIDEHPTESDTYLVNAGVYVFDRSVFAALDRTPRWGDELRLTDALDHLDGPVTSVLVGEGWLDPSNPWQLLTVTEALLARDGTNSVHASARIHPTAVVEGHVVVGPDCELGPGAVVRGGTCLQENVHVGPNAVVERSVLLTDARVGAGAVVRDSVVGPGVQLGDGVVSPGGLVDVRLGGTLHANRRLGSVVADRAVIGPNVTLEPGSQVDADATVRAGSIVTDPARDPAEVTA